MPTSISNKEVIKIQPIYNELIKMWSDLGFSLPITEGVYWLDNSLIKAFIKETSELVSLYKYKVFDDLSISITQHSNYDKYKDREFETWSDTARRLEPNIRQLELESIFLIQDYGSDDTRQIINTNSTGKDSMVLLKLIEKSGVKYNTYFNVTTLDVSQSNLMAKQLDFKFTIPRMPYNSFYNYVNKYDDIPSRLNRFCCEKFKETATIDEFDANKKLLFIFGMRNDESNSRSNYEDVWINKKWENRDWIGILPIRKFKEIDIWLYTFLENIQINPKYKMGYSRVGCAIACPNYTKTTWVLDKYWYPSLYNRWQNILRDNFIRNNKWIIMNCTVDEYCSKFWNGGIAYTEPPEEVIKEYAEYNNMKIEVAKKYFNRYCINGCSRKGKPLKIKDKEVLGMNMKMFGRSVEKFQCKKCLLKSLGISKEEWNDKAKGFKESGCVLF